MPEVTRARMRQPCHGCELGLNGLLPVCSGALTRSFAERLGVGLPEGVDARVGQRALLSVLHQPHTLRGSHSEDGERRFSYFATQPARDCQT